MNSIFSQQIVAGNVSPVVTDWVNRVQKNGGTKPSQNTISAVNNFYHNIASTTILGKMKSVNCFVPDSLSASLTPLIKSGDNDPWTNINFVASDLTINGLQGNASNKYLNTGLLPTTIFSDDLYAGITIYSTNAATNGHTIGTNTNGYNNSFLLLNSQGSFCYFESWNAFTVGSGVITAPTGSYQGYLSGNRVSSSMAMYMAKSTLPHVQVASGTGLTSTRPNASIGVFTTSLGATDYSNDRLSFAAVHLGLTQPESSMLFNFIQSFRQQIGGGYI